MKKTLSIIALSTMMVLIPIVSFAEEDLNAKIVQLESENEELSNKVTQLESENEELKAQLEAFQIAETEAQPSTEIVGVQYTDASIVKIVQQALNDAGYNCGTPDGQAGSKTAEAIRAFEKDHNINVNGVITDELLEALGVADKIAEEAAKEAQMQEYSPDYTYTQIARNPEAFKGDKMRFKGKVLQEGSAGEGMRYIRLAANSDYDTVLFITYEDGLTEYKILDDDVITIFGTCVGDYTYETVMGAEVTLPWIHADIIDMSDVSM